MLISFLPLEPQVCALRFEPGACTARLTGDRKLYVVQKGRHAEFLCETSVGAIEQFETCELAQLRGQVCIVVEHSGVVNAWMLRGCQLVSGLPDSRQIRTCKRLRVALAEEFHLTGKDKSRANVKRRCTSLDHEVVLEVRCAGSIQGCIILFHTDSCTHCSMCTFQYVCFLHPGACGTPPCRAQEHIHAWLPLKHVTNHLRLPDCCITALPLILVAGRHV